MTFTMEAFEIRIREKLRTAAVVDRRGRKGTFHDLVSIKEDSVGKTEDGSLDQLILTYKRSFLMGLDEQDGSLMKVWGKHRPKACMQRTAKSSESWKAGRL
ncbi:uncharacterized protein [Haliotis asinina]|uniref:uncharacterized protein n=1 Tax=Haliotis asinina TaxID=109174 RepID=UPI00353217D6